MIILSIETSCDDTGVAVLKVTGSKKKPSFKILSNIVSSQIEVHKKWGGVYPTLAKREHQLNLITVLTQSLKESRLPKNRKPKKKIEDQVVKQILEREGILCGRLLKFLEKYDKPGVDAIAVTIGPGLEPCLWVGVNFAKALAYAWALPIIPVNHLEAHILANWLKPSRIKNIFPAICLVVSGGHTQIILMKGFGKYKILGETRDDAAGECLDKVAKILELGYPGGPIISALAKNREVYRERVSVKLPRPMISQKNYDFSFSGLKTAVLYNYQNQPAKIKKSKQYIQSMCAEAQQAIIDVLLRKTMKAARDFSAKTVLLGGGVTANEELRKQFKTECLKSSIELLMPPCEFSTDNAAMAGAAAYFRQDKKTGWKNIVAKANLRI